MLLSCESGMSIFRFSAEFLFFFLLSAFLKMIFRVFWKIAKKNFFFRLPTPPLSTVRRASVNSRWRHGLPVCASSVSGRSSKVRYLHSTFEIWCSRPCYVLAYSVRCLNEEEGRVMVYRTPAFAPPPFPPSPLYTHTLSLSLSLSLSLCLSLSHCQLLRFRHSMVGSVLVCYTRAKYATVT